MIYSSGTVSVVALHYRPVPLSGAWGEREGGLGSEGGDGVTPETRGATISPAGTKLIHTSGFGTFSKVTINDLRETFEGLEIIFPSQRFAQLIADLSFSVK